MTIPILPIGIGVDALVAITFDTVVNPSESSVSGRKSMRLEPLRNYTVTIGPNDSPAVQEIYTGLLGERYPVAIRDWTSYAYTDQVLAWTVTATDQTTAPLRRKFVAGSRTVYERILIPDETEVPTIIKINGFTPGTGVIVNIVDPGEIVINYALSPGDVVTASGQFYRAVCFVEDLTATVRGRAPDGTVLYTYNDVRLRQIPEAEYRALVAS